MKLLVRGDAFLAGAQQLVRHDDHPASVADERLLVFEFLELDRGALARGADQVRQILMRKFERQQHATRILDAELGADFEQRAREPLTQSQSDEVGVANQHHPPSPDGRVKHAA